MKHAGELDAGRPLEGTIEEHIAIRDERSKIATEFRPTATQGWRAREQPRHVAKSRHDPAPSGLSLAM